jgi:hypothetical protein
MIEGKRGWRRSTRKLRLLVCACYRRVWHLLSDAGRKAIEVAERHADGRATNEELHAIQPAFIRGGNIADNGVHHAAAPNRFFRSWIKSALSFAVWAVEERGPEHDAEQLAQCHMLRDVFGPLRFRSVELVLHFWSDGIPPSRNSPKLFTTNGPSTACPSWPTLWKKPAARTRTSSALAGQGASTLGDVG